MNKNVIPLDVILHIVQLGISINGIRFGIPFLAVSRCVRSLVLPFMQHVVHLQISDDDDDDHLCFSHRKSELWKRKDIRENSIVQKTVVTTSLRTLKIPKSAKSIVGKVAYTWKSQRISSFDSSLFRNPFTNTTILTLHTPFCGIPFDLASCFPNLLDFRIHFGSLHPDYIRPQPQCFSICTRSEDKTFFRYSSFIDEQRFRLPPRIRKLTLKFSCFDSIESVHSNRTRNIYSYLFFLLFHDFAIKFSRLQKFRIVINGPFSPEYLLCFPFLQFATEIDIISEMYILSYQRWIDTITNHFEFLHHNCNFLRKTNFCPNVRSYHKMASFRFNLTETTQGTQYLYLHMGLFLEFIYSNKRRSSDTFILSNSIIPYEFCDDPRLLWKPNIHHLVSIHFSDVGDVTLLHFFLQDSFPSLEILSIDNIQCTFRSSLFIKKLLIRIRTIESLKTLKLTFHPPEPRLLSERTTSAFFADRLEFIHEHAAGYAGITPLKKLTSLFLTFDFSTIDIYDLQLVLETQIHFLLSSVPNLEMLDFQDTCAFVIFLDIFRYPKLRYLHLASRSRFHIDCSTLMMCPSIAISIHPPKDQKCIFPSVLSRLHIVINAEFERYFRCEHSIFNDLQSVQSITKSLQISVLNNDFCGFTIPGFFIEQLHRMNIPFLSVWNFYIDPQYLLSFLQLFPDSKILYKFNAGIFRFQSTDDRFQIYCSALPPNFHLITRCKRVSPTHYLPLFSRYERQ